jgi:hypothetical protein
MYRNTTRDVAGQLGNLPTEQDQQLDTPGQDHVQGNGPLEPFSGLVLIGRSTDEDCIRH